MWMFLAVCILSVGFAFFLSAWVPQPFYLSYVPQMPDDLISMISEFIILLCLYSPILYLIISTRPKGSRDNTK